MDWSQRLGLSSRERLLDLGEGLFGRVIAISPERAKAWLKFNKKNRSASESHVSRLLTDNKDGRFFTTHQGIAFYANGILADGQHRLMMIAASEEPVKMMVVTGIAVAAQPAIDDHRKRSDHDVCVLEGREIGKASLQVANSLLDFPQRSDSSLTKQRRIDFAEKHLDAIRFAENAFSVGEEKTYRQASLVAAVARAYYTADRDKLKVFAEVLATGTTSTVLSRDNPALKLRSFVAMSVTRNAGNERRFMYAMAITALDAFLSNETLTVPKASSHKRFKEEARSILLSRYPLPDETPVDASELVSV